MGCSVFGSAALACSFTASAFKNMNGGPKKKSKRTGKLKFKKSPIDYFVGLLFVIAIGLFGKYYSYAA
jgi:hypothetical protein